MNQISKIKISFFGAIVLIGTILVFALISAAKPGIAIVAAILGLCALITHVYLNSPVDENDDIKRIYPKRLAVLSIITYIFMPHLFYTMAEIGLVIGFTIPLIILLAGNYYALKYRDFKWRSARANAWIFAVIGSILLSMVYGYFAKAVPFNAKDILIIKEPVFYFLTFNLFFQMDWRPDDIKKYFLSPLLWSGFVTIIIAFAQYVNFADLNETVLPYWTEKHHLNELMKPDSRRVFATYYSAGNYGIFLVSLFSYLMAKIYSDKSINRIPTYALSILGIIALFLCGSKGAFIIFILMIVIFPMVFYIDPAKRTMGTVTALVGLILISILSMPLIGDTFMMQRMESVQDSISTIIVNKGNVQLEDVLDETFVGRYAPWVFVWPKIMASPILGYGPAKSILHEQSFHLSEEESFKNPFESTYLSLMFRFGLLGLIVGIGLLFHIIGLMKKLLKTKDIPIEYHQIASANYAFCILMLITFFNTDAIYNMRIMFSIYAVAGIIASYLLSIEKETQRN